MKVTTLNSEVTRLEALREYEILDTLPDQAFDDLTSMAAQMFDVPIAFIGFIDTDRQWFKSKVGIGVEEIPRHISLCSQTILTPDLRIICDALADERLATNPMVVSKPHFRF